MESGDINKTFRKSIEDSKKEISNVLQPPKKQEKENQIIDLIVNLKNSIF